MSVDNTPDNIEPVTEADLASFAQRLQAWGENLPVHERAVLQLLLSRSETADEIQGYGLNSPFLFNSSLVSMQLTPVIRGGLGINADAGNWLNVGWQKSDMPQAFTNQQRF